MAKQIKLAIVGAGGMAHAHVRECAKMRNCAVVAAVDVDDERAKTFAASHDIPHAFASQRVMLRTVEVDAVINATPDSYHAPLTVEALAAGKHVLCEKPLATTYRDALRMARAAEQAGVVALVNFSYRCSSALQHMQRIIARGDIGRPIHFHAHYLQSWLATAVWGDWRTSPNWLWRLSSAHGSQGVLGDIGVHILDFVSFPLGAYRSISCSLKTFSKADGDRVGDYVLDANDSAVMHCEMENGALGVIHTSRWATGHRNSLALAVYGDAGALRIDLDKGYDLLEQCRGARSEGCDVAHGTLCEDADESSALYSGDPHRSAGTAGFPTRRRDSTGH